ncbi:YHYH domain-containing protein [Motilimonas cestriensis]|uniref:YHYH domain-containing protein n=1 Tax=Motilimonas cestriensis TaxID=2742685 RepID=A0ABS8WDG2_9GAMM|nr:YHYH domain-containing protein [Motilimonas cestriensis]MCE2596608.1 YHYH domain-containing protein [Motilimonas cestriensis]
MKKLLLASLTVLSCSVTAHPGRTASDGCHYCRTNCASWGEIAGERHCHNNNSTDNPFFDGMSVKTVDQFEHSLEKPVKEPKTDLSAVAINEAQKESQITDSRKK